MHIGLIPDGNRRFMVKQHIQNLLMSYDLGINKFYDFLEWCNDLGVKEVTIYALSLENITGRGASEVNTLYNVFSKHAIKGINDSDLHEKKIRVCVLGDLDFIVENSPNKPAAEEMVANLRKLEHVTSEYANFRLNLAIGYGGRQEILHAVNALVEKSEDRLSNFLLWQSAYSEIFFVNKLWQEFGKDDLEVIVKEYKDRERRYGR